ncbi:unnamed protein product [Ectocarpus sp. CCAP 1310/34]|nr:unnamed protein product [Ectocarpus sp. CCAP 1310/34]
MTMGRFQSLCESLGIIIQPNTPHIPQGNAIAERVFGTIIVTARNLLLGAPHLSARLWAEAVKTAVYINSRTPTDVLDGKAPLEVPNLHSTEEALHTTEEAYERIEHALLTGGELGNMGTGSPGEVGYMHSDPANYDKASRYEHDVFDWVDPPEGVPLIPSKFIHKWKYNQDGVPIRRKSRVAVQGFHEADTGADKAAPVASMEPVHLVIAMAAHQGLVLKQADIKTAFLHARIPEEVEPIYMIRPKGFQYDILFTGTDGDQVSTVIEQLKDRSDTVNLGDARFLLGMAIERSVEAGTILLTQEVYTKAVLAKFGTVDAHPTKTPAEVGTISVVEGEALSPEDTTMFRSATGSALYLCRGSRPEIAHTVLVLTRSMAKPGPKVMAKLKRLLRYLKETSSIGIAYTEHAEQGNLLTAYVDSDFAGDGDDRRSTTGVVLFLAGGPVDWRSVKQMVVALSSVEAEYVAMSKACTMIIHYRHLLSINQTQEEATRMFEDNTAAISTSVNNKLTPRTKHIGIKYHHVRSLIEDKVVAVEYIESDAQKADILTKSLGAVKFLRNRLLLLGVSTPPFCKIGLYILRVGR